MKDRLVLVTRRAQSRNAMMKKWRARKVVSMAIRADTRGFSLRGMGMITLVCRKLEPDREYATDKRLREKAVESQIVAAVHVAHLCRVNCKTVGHRE